MHGAPHCSDRSVALYYVRQHALDREGTCDIVKGYALHADGPWLPHGWVWDGKRALDTDAGPVLYFGAVLTPAEAAAYVLDNLVPQLPGARRVA